MKDLKISVNKETRYVNLVKTTIGVDGENLQEKIVFSFEDEFVDGTARLEYENTDGKQYVLLDKEEETYTIPVRNVITKKGNIKMQLVITQGTDTEEIPVFKSNQFYLWCEESINAVTEAPDSYELWIETANTKLNEVNNLDIEIVTEDGVTKVIVTKKDGTKEETIVATGGALDYDFLDNLPSINEIILKGNLTTEELGILEDVKKYIDENKEELRGEPGEDGEQGVPGEPGENGLNGITPTIGANGNWYLGDVDTGKPSRGEPGQDGKPGKDGSDGYTPIKGVDYFDGEPGQPGEQGIQGEPGYTPVKGTDYYTEADKQEMVNLVINSVNEELGLLIDEINGEVI